MDTTIAILALSALNFALLGVVYKLAILVKAQDLAEYRNEKEEKEESPYVDPIKANLPFDPINQLL